MAVDSQDNVYVLTRGAHPIMVFDREGNFIRSFGEGLFSNRTHGIYIAHDDSVLAAVLAGAHGYVLKEIDSAALLRAVHSVAEGHSILDPIVTERALAWLRGIGGGSALPGTDPLSAQEERVLALVAEGQTNKEIASALNLSDKTVKNYLANVFQKLRVTRRAQAAAFFAKRKQ